MSAEDKYCAYCGNKFPAGAAFCFRCGSKVAETGAAAAAATAVGGTGAGAVPPPPTYQRRYRNEKNEKEEKDEKNEKNEKNEKGKDSDVSGALFGGGVLIWLGVTFYLATTQNIAWTNWWSYFVSGVGVMLLVLGLFRSMKRGSYSPFLGFFIGGAVLLFIGATSIFSTGTNWYFWLIFIGIAIIIIAILGRRRVPMP
jgi:amino acid transporter